MTHQKLNRCLIAYMVLCMLMVHSAFAADPIHRKHFTQPNPIVDVALSPDGQTSAVLLRTTARLFELWQLDMANMKATKRTMLRQGDELVWYTNSQQLLVLSQNTVTQVNMTDNKPPRLVTRLEPKDKLIISGPHRAHNLFVSRPTAKKSRHQLQRVINNEVQTLLSHEDPMTGVLMSDKTSTTYRKTVSQDYSQVSQVIDGSERNLFSCSVSTLENPCQLIAESNYSDSIYIVGRFQSDLSGLYLYTAKTNTFELVHQDPVGIADLEKVILDEFGQPLMILYRGLTNQWYGIQDNARKMLSSVSMQVKETTKDIQCSDGLASCLFISESPNRLSRDYYAYDKGQNIFVDIGLNKIFVTQELVQSDPIDITVEPMTYQTSDGMTQYGYLYLPKNQPLDVTPLVVYPHGGPHSRDHYQSNRFALFLANRGYAVLKPNFRGSTGFGLHYMSSSNNEFGQGRVLDDLFDAIDWVRQKGISTKAPMAVVGESFGGFSAVAAATFDSRFAVAIAAMPALDIGKVRKSIIDRQVRIEEIERLSFLWGDLNDDALRRKLHKFSPVKHAESLNTPLYIWAGARDPIVPVSHIKSYALQQQRNRKSISLMIDNQAKHGPSTQHSMHGYMAMMEHVLSHYLNGKVQAVEDSKLKKSLVKMQVIDSTGWLSKYWSGASL